MKKGIVLVSGGMDSLVTAAIAKSECEEVYFLHVNYGQKTSAKERSCFEHIVKHYQPQKSLIVDIGYLKQIGGSSLTDDKMDVKNFSGKKEIPNSYVPFRNANLICIAVSWAEVIGANRIYLGAVEEDSSGYPDCREVFFENMEKTIATGTKNEMTISLHTPVIHKTKAEIVKIGKELNAPFAFSWSCYRENEIACGTCDSCVLRLKAFQEAGFEDEIEYKIIKEGNHA
jgi:7-cyano-7-deazaguanine synthase